MVEHLEVEGDHVTVETSCSAHIPAKLPIIVRCRELRPAGYVLHGVLVGQLLHGQAILHEHSGPLTGSHGLHIEGSFFMYLLNCLEKRLWVVGEETWVRERGVTEHMVLKHVRVQEAVSELRVGSSLNKCSDQC